jgi:hypothetical protein
VLYEFVSRRIETAAILSKIVARDAAQTIQKLIVRLGQREHDLSKLVDRHA